MLRIEGLQTALAVSAAACMIACTPTERCFDPGCTTGSGGAGEGGQAGGSSVSSSTSSSGGGPEGSVCGDGTKDPDEACDTQDVGATSCEELRFFGGTLACLANCQLDELPCAKSCGNGAVDEGERCDGASFGAATCMTILPQSPGGELACDAACAKVDASGCAAPLTCGSGVVDQGEQCDGVDLAGQTCSSQGFASGGLGCNRNCSFDNSACTACGNGTLDAGELCDGPNLNGQTCESRGFAPGGSPLCGTDCRSFTTAVCDPCGNAVINSQEACDGAALGGATCQSLGFSSGTLACQGGCTFDTSACNN